MAIAKLYKLHKDRTKIAGITVGGNGTVRYSETATTVSPQGGLRIGMTAVVAIVETLTFSIEEATIAKTPKVGNTGITEFDAQELLSGSARGPGIKGTAAKSTVVNVGRDFNISGQPTVEVTVNVESADEEESGMEWEAGAP
jgi:hypothetical protein